MKSLHYDVQDYKASMHVLTYMYPTAVALDDEDMAQPFSIDADQSILRMERKLSEAFLSHNALGYTDD